MSGIVAPGDTITFDEVTQKPHLSPSQIDLYTKCGEAYRRRYILGEKIPPRMAMLKGTGVHGGAAVNFRQKLETRRDLPANEIVDAAVAEFETAAAGGYELDREEASRGAAIIVGETKDAVRDLARLHAEDVAPEYQPVAVEQAVRILLPTASRDILGVLDLADENDCVVDHKISGKAKSQGEADHSVQLTVYAAAHRILTGRPAREVRLEVLVDGSRPKRQLIRSKRGLEDFQALSNRVNAVLGAVDAGIFPPASPGSWWCSDRWCGYWRSCPFVAKGEHAVYDIAPLPKAAETPAVAEQEHTDDAGQALPPFTPGHFDDPPFDSQFAYDESRDDVHSESPTNGEIVDPAAYIPKKRATRKPNKGPREALLKLNPHCCWCGRKLTSRTATLDHRVPLAQGGENKPENYVLSCRACNLKRGDTGLHPDDVSDPRESSRPDAAPVAVAAESLKGGL